MKLSLGQLRKIIKEVYMSPRHIRGIGPEVDKDQMYGKIDSTHAMMVFPDAINAIVQDFYDSASPDDFEELFGTDNPYPKDIADLYTFKLVDGVLHRTWNDGTWWWDPLSGENGKGQWQER